jgi:phosphate transport system substrate-binding protein
MKSLFYTMNLVMAAVLVIAVPKTLAQTNDGLIRVSGSDSMAARMQILTRMFTKDNPDIKLQMLEDQLVDAGIVDVIDDKADVAIASRRINEKENDRAIQKRVLLVERLIGYGGVVIITNPENLVNDLSVEQVQKIFTGEITRWDQLGGSSEKITVVKTDETQHPGTLVFMEHDFLGDTPFTKHAVSLTNFPGVIAYVATHPNAVGYVRVRDALDSKPKVREGIKILQIRRLQPLIGVMPSRETIKNGSYPIKRPYYLYYRTDANKNVGSYADFIISKGWGPQNW